MLYSEYTDTAFAVIISFYDYRKKKNNDPSFHLIV